jgi:hypothetical protein
MILKSINLSEKENPNADETAARQLLPKMTKDYTCYMIDDLGRLRHTRRINYSVMKKFVNHWFPNCWYAKHISEYDSHDGLPLFQELSPAQNFIARCRELKIIAMAQPHGTLDENFNWNPKKFVVFTEDNEMPDRLPHAHVCVNINNRQYKGNSLRSVDWADKYKSIFSVRLINSENTEPYTADNLLVEEEVEKDYYRNMSEKDKTELVSLLNREKSDLWRCYLENMEYEENE